MKVFLFCRRSVPAEIIEKGFKKAISVIEAD
jgi:hypothetical protein